MVSITLPENAQLNTTENKQEPHQQMRKANVTVFEPRHHCTSSLPSSLQNDVPASRLLTEHTSADVIVLFIVL